MKNKSTEEILDEQIIEACQEYSVRMEELGYSSTVAYDNYRNGIKKGIELYKRFEKDNEIERLNKLCVEYCEIIERGGNQYTKMVADYLELQSKLSKFVEALENADSLLAYFEDFTKGEDGMKITRLRGEITDKLYTYKK